MKTADTLETPEGVAIHCQDLVRIFTAQGIEVQALQGVDLRVSRGELVAVIGVSGSGKSTLMSILSGTDTPTAGKVVVGGHDLMRMSRAERVRYQRETVGFVWQSASSNLFPYLTAQENVEMVLRLGGVAQRSQRSADLLELLGVAGSADRKPSELSGGEQQRVAVAVALANDPDLLLADEPTGELDEESTNDVLEALQTVNRERGITTLIVTHDPVVAAHVRRTIQIRDGRIVTETMRRRRRGMDGTQEVVSEEFAVVDRLGRMQLPEDARHELGLTHHVRLEATEDHLAIWPIDPGSDEPS